MKVFQTSKYRCGDIISDVELHADSEYGIIFLQFLLVKKTTKYLLSKFLIVL